MFDPLTFLLILGGGWGVYRKFIRPHMPRRVIEEYHEDEEALLREYEEFINWKESGGLVTTPVVEHQGELAALLNSRPAKKVTPDDAEARVRKAVAELPKLVKLEEMFPLPKSPLTVPLGISLAGVKRYMDVGDDALNVAVYGTSGSGKDTLIMGWFLSLCTRNTPDQIQFLVLDGKGHWLTPNLRGLAHMFADPCGGYGQSGTEKIEAGLSWIDDEAQRRTDLIFGQGYRSRDQYVEETGEVLPIIVVLITDGMDAIQGLIEHLLISLASKGRALGFKVIVSMSTPTKRDMRWRINLSTVLSGPLVDRSQNSVALGLPSDAIIYPPSFLPDPKARHGTFVARFGAEQFMVQAPYVSDEQFDQVVATLLRRAPDAVLPADRPIARARKGQVGSNRGDPVKFIEDAVMEAPGASVTGAVLYEAYTEWCVDNDLEPLNNTAFGMAVKKADLLKKERSGKGLVVYRDIALAVVEEVYS